MAKQQNPPRAAEGAGSTVESRIPMPQYEKITWIVLALVAAAFIAAIATSWYRHDYSIDNALTVPEWNLELSEKMRDYDKVEFKDAVVLIKGRKEYIKLADVCGQNPQRGLELVRKGLNSGVTNQVLTAGALAPLLVGDGLKPEELKPLIKLATPLKEDLEALGSKNIKPEAGERLTVNRLALNLLERIILVEKSAGDGQLTGYVGDVSDFGNPEKKVTGTWIVREGLNGLYWGTVRFDNLGAQANYWAHYLDKVVVNGKQKMEIEIAPGERRRTVKFFVLPKDATAKN